MLISLSFSGGGGSSSGPNGLGCAPVGLSWSCAGALETSPGRRAEPQLHSNQQPSSRPLASPWTRPAAALYGRAALINSAPACYIVARGLAVHCLLLVRAECKLFSH